MLTSGEVAQLLAAHNSGGLQAAPEAPLDSLVPNLPDDGRLYGLPGGSGEGLHRSALHFSSSCMMRAGGSREGYSALPHNPAAHARRQPHQEP